jgi:acyl-CoA synthetase (NDP forming)
MTSIESAQAALARYSPLFQPRSVAVVGASPNGSGPGNNFLRHLRAYGFAGEIYPIHPSAQTIDGLKVYPALDATPQDIDYAYVAIAAERVPDVLATANGRVRFAQIMSSGFAENRNGWELQARLVDTARLAKVRLLGPNCMGTHSPRGRLTFVENADTDLGPIGVLSQSGGLSIDILRRGQIRGLKFSGLVTLGNSADLDACDLLEYFLADPQTRVIGLYLEDVRDGRRLLDLLQAATGTKPVVLLKGGRTRQGQRATASHTGAMAGDDRIWTGVARQFGMALVQTLDEFLNALLGFQCLRPNTATTRRVVLFGNGGGTSVLAADSFGALGFEIERLKASTLEVLEGLHLPAGSSVDNPIDVPANALRMQDGRVVAKILDVLLHHDSVPDALVIHINVPVILGYKQADILANLIDVILTLNARISTEVHLLLVLRSDGDLAIEERRRRFAHQAIGESIPTFGELIDAAQALSAMRDYERFLAKIATGCDAF